MTGKSIWEDVAKGCFIGLLKKSLLMTSKKIAHFQIKAFSIHTTLQSFCLKKAEEEHLSPHIYRYANVQAPASSRTITNMLHEMSLNHLELGDILRKGGSILSEKFKFIRVCDMEYVPLSVFPSYVTQLVNLRYLAIQAEDGSPQASISNLVNLHTLIISSKKNIVVPKNIWNMVKLRHVCITTKSGENITEEPNFVQVTENSKCCPVALASLKTLFQVTPRSCKSLSSRTPNLRKLGLCGPLTSSLGDLKYPNICDLSSPQKLKFLNTNFYPMFPENLKKLTLSNTGLNWEEMWTFAWLPNLKVLELKNNACTGETWETWDT